jgi:hypothetical protein
MPMTRTVTPSRTGARFSRTGTPATTRSRMRRRQPPKSGPKRALESVTALVPAVAKQLSGRSSKTKRRRRGGKAGGLALATAAAGMAVKNRQKLMSMFRREGSASKADTETSPVEAGTRPTAGSADPIRSGNIAPTDPGNRPDIASAG